jgi:hypothetical protein
VLRLDCSPLNSLERVWNLDLTGATWVAYVRTAAATFA